jgi:hypothetical protein
LEPIINDEDTFEDQCKKFGELLRLGKPVTAEVLISALHNEDYAKNLIANKRSVLILRKLLSSPPEVKSNHKPEHHFSTGELIANAAIAMIRWSKAGFTKVDLETLERRENACLSCPNLVDPEKLIQKIIAIPTVSNEIGERTGNHVCDLCGCHIKKKIKVISEVCPDKHPDKEGFTRWDEPIRKH